jgi:hypothetical protein
MTDVGRHGEAILCQSRRALNNNPAVFGQGSGSRGHLVLLDKDPVRVPAS